jgi:ankyrin repeat protein
MKHSADVMLDAKTSYGSTALHLSIQQGHIEIVKFLARKSAEQVVHHATDAQGRTALQLASYLGHVDIVQHLIEHCSVDTNVKTTSGCTALHLACLAGRVTVVEYFAKCGGRIDIEATCNAGRTALLWACTKRGNVSVVKALVQAGASLTVVDQCGWTAIHHASHSGHVDIVRYLVDVASVGADEVTRDGDTPLHLASQQGHVKVVQYLLGTGIVSVNKAALEDGAMTLHFASRYGHLDVVKYLVNHTPAKIDAAIHVGWPATQLPKKDAVMTGDFGLIGITHKVSLIGDNDGTTALHVACFHGHVNIVEFLLANCCTHVEESDHKGRMPCTMPLRVDNCQWYSAWWSSIMQIWT